MESIKLVKESLLNKGIKRYKIISLDTKQLWYKESFESISYDCMDTTKLFVIFNVNDKVSKFNISATDNIEIIESLIETCLENAQETKYNWSEQEYNFKCNNDDTAKNYFEKFNIDSTVNFLMDNLNTVKKSTGLKINSSYIININRYRLLTNNSYCEQFYMTSNLLCIENISFQKKACLNNILLDDQFSSRIIDEFNKDNPMFNIQPIKNNKHIILKKEAVKDIINNYVIAFYASNIYNCQSFLTAKSIGKKLAKRSFDLISVPFENIYFDLEGTALQEKYIISNGKVENFLSNSIYSQYLNIDSYGNTDLENPEIISHQRLKFTSNEPNFESLPYNNDSTVIYKFENLTCNFNTETFNGLAYCESNQEKFYAMIDIKFSDFFDNIYSLDNQYQWTDNIYCTDIIFINSGIKS